MRTVDYFVKKQRSYDSSTLSYQIFIFKYLQNLLLNQVEGVLELLVFVGGEV